MRLDEKGRRATIAVLLAAAAAFGILYGMSQRNNAACGTTASADVRRLHNEREESNTMSTAAPVTTHDFEKEVLQAKEPVLVDFWAPWCMPCRMLAPVVDQLATQYAGRVKVAKVNVDENQGLAAKYSIQGVPTLILFKNGQPVDRVVGLQSKAALASRLDQALGD